MYLSTPATSSTFNAYGSFSSDKNLFNYYITETSTTIQISEHRIPIIGDINFNTESYMERLANINEQAHFDLLIDPQTTDPISNIEIIIPT